MATKQFPTLSNYNPVWVSEFKNERNILLSIIPESLKAHVVQVGSTAVEGLISRNIIDIAVGVENPLNLITVRDLLISKKYLYSPKGSSLDHFVLGKKVNGSIKFIIHLIKYNGQIYRDMGYMIKCLKNNPALLNEYSGLKARLSREKVDIRTYSIAKRDFIKGLSKR